MLARFKPCYHGLRSLHQVGHARLREARRDTPTTQPGDKLTLPGRRIRLAV
jgi:hypothetical protein